MKLSIYNSSLPNFCDVWGEVNGLLGVHERHPRAADVVALMQLLEIEEFPRGEYPHLRRYMFDIKRKGEIKAFLEAL